MTCRQKIREGFINIKKNSIRKEHGFIRVVCNMGHKYIFKRRYFINAPLAEVFKAFFEFLRNLFEYLSI